MGRNGSCSFLLGVVLFVLLWFGGHRPVSRSCLPLGFLAQVVWAFAWAGVAGRGAVEVRAAVGAAAATAAAIVLVEVSAAIFPVGHEDCHLGFVVFDCFCYVSPCGVVGAFA